MYQNYYNVPRQYYRGDDRFVGGFLGPFLLGGITGGLVSPFFYNNRPYNNSTPYYNNNNYYPYPYQNYYTYYR